MVRSEQHFQIKQQWHSEAQPIRIICVGAGAAGLLLAYKMKKSFQNYELVCYDKNPKVGGTWYENRYPGCACDIPAHVYTYSFDPNPDWSSFYARAPEILKYFENFAEKHSLHQWIKLNSRVLSADWREKTGTYDVEVNVNGEHVKDWCNVLVNGTGFLNSWKWPDIPDLQSFAGTLAHTANWDTSIDVEEKTVAVIGTGSSAIQIVPMIQKEAKQLVAFMRSVTWISPPIAGDILEETRVENSVDHDAATATSKNGQYYFTELEKKRFSAEPGTHLAYRQMLEASFATLFQMFIKDSEASKAAEAGMRAEMLRRIGSGHEELKQKLIPSWPPGCKRITPGDGYLEALIQPNVRAVHKEISKVTREGLIDASGELHKVDILVCATGFNIAFAPPFDLRGVEGLNMKDAFDPEPQVYLAVAVPKFPNYFIVNGPRGNWAAGSALPSHEVQVDYILECVKRVQTEDIRALEVKQKPIEDLYEYIDAWHESSVWSADCKSWYKQGGLHGKLWIWAGSALHYMKTMKLVRWEHYEFRYRTRNIWSFLGNGQVEAQVKKDLSRMAPYIRNEDVAWNID